MGWVQVVTTIAAVTGIGFYGFNILHRDIRDIRSLIREDHARIGAQINDIDRRTARIEGHLMGSNAIREGAQ